MKKLLVLLCDVILFSIALVVIFEWRLQTGVSADPGSVAALVVLQVLLLYVFGAYEMSPLTKQEISIRVALAVASNVVAAVLVTYLFSLDRWGLLGRGILFGSSAMFLISAIGLRWWVLRRSSFSDKAWLFLVSPETQIFLQEDLARKKFLARVEYLSWNEKTWSRLFEKPWTGIVVETGTSLRDPLWVEKLSLARLRGQRLMDPIHFYEQHWQQVPVKLLSPEWFILAQGFSVFRRRVSLKLKRLLDLLFVLMVFLISLPLSLLAMVLIFLEDRGPIFYSQLRVGRNEQVFRIFKFRSMVVQAESEGVAVWAVSRDPRVTRVGKWLRKTRIDELPQLWNVMVGDMSFVGPRPERPEFVAQLESQIPYYRFRHTVAPGLTGWAQISFPYGASIEDAREKLQYELFYIRNHSLWFDLRILLKTARIVLTGGGR